MSVWTRRQGLVAGAVAMAVAACTGDNQSGALWVGNCDTCSVSVAEAWSSIPEDPNVNPGGVWLEGGGYFWSAGGFAGHLVTRFDLTSRVSFQFDRLGEGPGEFPDIVDGLVDITGDTLVLTETSRVSMLDLRFQYTRSFASPVRLRSNSLVQIADGTFVAWSPTTRNVGDTLAPSLHHVSSTGELLQSWDSVTLSRRIDRKRLFPSPAPDRFWALQTRESGVRAELWDVRTREVETVVTLEPDWWYSSSVEPEEREARTGRPDPPDSGAYGLYARGREVWIVLSHAGEQWMTWDSEVYDPAARHDYVLVAVDLDTGLPIASKTFTNVAVHGFTTGGHLLTYELDGVGYPRLRLHDVELHR